MKNVRAVFGGTVMLPIAALLGLAAWFYFMDLNDYKGTIAKTVEAATGRALTIEGNIEKSFVPWLGLKLGAMEMSNAPGFGDTAFASVETVGIKVALIPLFSRRIEVDTIVLDGLSMNLQRNRDGTNNWDDLVKVNAAPKQSAPKDKKPLKAKAAISKTDWLAGLVIGGLNIDNAKIHWVDQQVGRELEISNLDITSGAVRIDHPIDLEVFMGFRSEAPAVEGELQWSGKVELDLASGHYQLKNNDLFLALGGDAVPIPRLNLALQTDVDINLMSQTLKFTRLNLRAAGLKLQGDVTFVKILQDPLYTGHLQLAPWNPRQVMTNMGFTVVTTNDPYVLTKATVDAEFTGTLDTLDITALTVTADDTRINGTIGIKQFSRPAIDFDLKVTALDIDRYVAPPEIKKVAGNAPKKTGASQSKPPTSLPLAALRELDVNGRLKVVSLTVAKAVLKDVDLVLVADKGVLRAQPVNLNLYGGSLNGDIQVDVRTATPRLAFNQSARALNILPLLKDTLDNDKLVGLLDSNAHLTGTGSDMDALIKTLNGGVDFHFRDGAIKDFNLAEEIRKAYAKYRKKELPPSRDAGQTDFTEITGSLAIKQGIAFNNDLSAKSPLFRVGGKGTVDLPKGTVDYTARFSIVKTAEGQGGLGLDELQAVTIPVIFRGPLEDPKIKVDLKTALKRAAKKAIKKEKQKIKKRLEAKKQEKKEELKKKRDQEKEELKEKLKEKFKKLF